MNKLKALLIAGLLSLTSVSFASTITAGTSATFGTTSSGTINLVHMDPVLTVFGDFGNNTVRTYDLNVSPVDSTGITIGTSNDAPGNIYSILFELYDATDLGTVLAFGNNLNVALSSTTNYILKLTGTLGTSYTMDVAAVPVPAAGILFASALLGAGAFGRRKKKSAKTSMVGAFARAS